MRLPLVLFAVVGLSGCFPFFPFHDKDDDHEVEDTGFDRDDDDDDGRPDGDDDGDGRPDGNDDCEAWLDDCLSSGQDPEGCAAGFDQCRGVDPGEDPGEEGCELELRTCLESGEDPRRCDARYRTCLSPDEPPVDTDAPPADPEAACAALFDVCTDAGLPEDFCGEQLQACLDVHAADPCEAFAEACVELGLEPAYCRDAYGACVTQAP